MKHVSEVLRVGDLQGGGRLLLAWCPGCDRQHAWYVVDDQGVSAHGPGHTWTWDGNIDRPTIGPSLLVHPDPPLPSGEKHVDGYKPQPLCHSYVRDGRWEFLSDSTHHLAGQTVDLVPLPDWLRNIDGDDQ